MRRLMEFMIHKQPPCILISILRSDKSLFAVNNQIAVNCRIVEHSRQQYVFDRPGWNQYHIPWVEEKTAENVKLRNFFKINNMLDNQNSVVGQFMALKHKGFDHLYQ